MKVSCWSCNAMLSVVAKKGLNRLTLSTQLCQLDGPDLGHMVLSESQAQYLSNGNSDNLMGCRGSYWHQEQNNLTRVGLDSESWIVSEKMALFLFFSRSSSPHLWGWLTFLPFSLPQNLLYDLGWDMEQKGWWRNAVSISLKWYHVLHYHRVRLQTLTMHKIK